MPSRSEKSAIRELVWTDASGSSVSTEEGRMWSVIEAAPAMASKVCAACGGRYPSDALFCPTDGAPLQSAAAAEREAEDPYLGQEISGHIEIRQLVGVGAMGRVYRAFQRGIDRDVAVKILHRELSANAQLVSRFTREAKVASRLQHPNVVQVLLAGQLPDRALYMVMEYLDGLSLQSALAAAGGSLSLNRALHIALQLCEAAGEAHAQGIVHRDLKPENVMLVRRGSDPDYVKVLDFGIARINWGEQSVATAAGLIFGTARYISPEGAQGNAVGPASDVYAIGTLLYQMLSGRTPFDGDQAVGLLVQQIHDPAPDLRSIPRAAYVPQPIADVVMATLVKDPTKREPDARALGLAIFDAAKLAGLSPDEFSRPMMKRPAAMKLPPMEQTKQHELTPDVVERMGPAPKENGTPAPSQDLAQRTPTAATVKWEPSMDFHVRLEQGVRGSAPASAEPKRPASRVDETIDDLTLDAEQQARMANGPAPTPTPKVIATVPGDVEGPARTQYTPPIAEVVTPSAPIAVRPPSSPDHGARISTAEPPNQHAPSSRRTRGLVFIALCFVMGVVIALGWAWKAGKLGGGDAEEERFVARATDAMFKNHFSEPPGDNVKEITDEGLRRWPNDRRLLDVRVRAANELTSQAITQRSAGDITEAIRLVKLAHELDPNDSSAVKLAEQYESELQAFNPAAAPTLTSATPQVPAAPPSHKTAAPPSSVNTHTRADYKVVVDVSTASPRLGQTIDFVAHVAPPKGDFDGPGFTISGPGVPGGVRMPAQATGAGTFKASYAFLEGGKFEVMFSAQASGKAISAKRTVTAGGGAPAPKPTPTPTPPPTASVKWM